MNDVNDLIEMDEIINFIKPRYVGIKQSEQDYNKNYEKYARSPAFRNDMKKLDFQIKTKNDEEQKNFRGWEVKDLHNFYLFDYCLRSKCQVIFGDLDEDLLNRKEIAKNKMKELKENMSKNLDGLVEKKETSIDVSLKALRNEFLVEQMMDKISPRYTVMPQPLNKTLFAIGSAEDIEQIGQIWKNKFKNTYKHEIQDAVEDDDEQQLVVIKKQNERFKY